MDYEQETSLKLIFCLKILYFVLFNSQWMSTDNSTWYRYGTRNAAQHYNSKRPILIAAHFSRFIDTEGLLEVVCVTLKVLKVRPFNVHLGLGPGTKAYLDEEVAFGVEAGGAS